MEKSNINYDKMLNNNIRGIYRNIISKSSKTDDYIEYSNVKSSAYRAFGKGKREKIKDFKEIPDDSIYFKKKDSFLIEKNDNFIMFMSKFKLTFLKENIDDIFFDCIYYSTPILNFHLWIITTRKKKNL